MTGKKDQLYTDTYFARQPIFDKGKTVWGYELLYRRNAGATKADFDDKDVATLTVLSNALSSRSKKGQDITKLLIHITADSIFKEILLALPCQSTIALIDKSFSGDPKALQALGELKRQGYSMALNHYDGSPECQALIPVVDQLFIDVAERGQPEIESLAQAGYATNRTLAAKRVETVDKFELIKTMGFTLFQGFFFQKPEIVPGRKLTSNQVARISLMKIISAENQDFDEMAKVIQSDVSISYRLLSFINSPAFGFPRKIESIKQAIVLLGWKQIKSWLLLVILSDLTPTGGVSELHFLSAIRGKFLEQVSLNHQLSILPDTLFLLGLFSLLEPLLEIPIQDVAANLPLEDEIKDALCGKENMYTPWLNLAKSFERGDWATIDTLVGTLSLDSMNVANSYAQALSWATSFREGSE